MFDIWRQQTLIFRIISRISVAFLKKHGADAYAVHLAPNLAERK